VLKSGTKFTDGSSIKNKNTSYQTNGREFTVLKDTIVYDNTSGKLIPFANIKKGSKATIASDYGNWWRIVIADKVGYVLKEDVSVSFTASDQYFMVTKEQLPVYDNRKGYLDLIGYLEKGQIYPRVSDYGNWHQIQVGNYYGYVLKSGTTLSSGLGLRNENKEYPTTGRELTVIRETKIYDNKTGKLVSFGVLKPGVKVNIATDYGNWWRIVHGGKVGYILKDDVRVGFASDDKYFRTIKDNVPVYDNRTGKLVKIAELPLGVEYKRISDYGNWHQIQVNDHFGYVLKSDTSLTYGENIVNESRNLKGEYIRISPGDNVKVYEATSTSAKYFAVLEKDISYQVIDINNNWYIVLFGNRVGYISRNDLTEKRYYDYSLSNMVDVQMTRSPQTDKYRNEPAFIHSSTVTETTNWVILGSGVALRTEPTTAGGNSTVVARLNSGTRVEYMAEVTGEKISDSNRWYQVKYNNQTLYVHSLYLSNGTSLSTNSNVNVRSQTNTNSHVYTQLAVNSNIAATKTVTGQVVSGSDKWYQINIGTWRLPTRADLEAYVNPNLQDSFQFLDLSKRSNITQSQIKSILIGNGILEGKEASFIKAGEKYGVNEVYLISHAILETGRGKSQLATGVKVGKNSSGSPVLVTKANEKNLKEIKTVYNMYGIAAYDSSPLSSGAIHAYKNGWTTPDIAIVEGAKFVKSSYIDRGQTTLYKMRWNPDNPGQHQYATDIGWAAKQVTHIKNLYKKISNPTINLEFPVYK
jgi:mannosyl-glycoprotein endo-beta-N-acetylglucosaminidase